jgi:hypothetical protein
MCLKNTFTGRDRSFKRISDRVGERYGKYAVIDNNNKRTYDFR